MEKRRFYLVLCQGERAIDINEADLSKTPYDIAKSVVGGIVETVPWQLHEKYDMIIHEEGWFVDNPVPNPVASLLYGFKEHGRSIVGNAVLMKNVQTEDGVDWSFMTLRECERLANKIISICGLSLHDLILS